MCLFFFDACGNKRKKRGKQKCFPLFKCSGWKVGLEPTTFRTTICRSNQLNYVHHLIFYVCLKKCGWKVGLEPTTFRTTI